jgi:hypothetical protein
MAKIVSRVDTDTERLQELQDIVVRFSQGIIGKPGDNKRFDVGQTYDAALCQVQDVLLGLESAAVKLTFSYEQLALREAITSMKLEAAEDTIAQLVDDISFDDAMDHAAIDLIDGICSSGAADTNADGELVFDERVVFTKEDLKPYLREAIVSWVEAKLSK